MSTESKPQTNVMSSEIGRQWLQKNPLNPVDCAFVPLSAPIQDLGSEFIEERTADSARGDRNYSVVSIPDMRNFPKFHAQANSTPVTMSLGINPSTNATINAPKIGASLADKQSSASPSSTIEIVVPESAAEAEVIMPVPTTGARKAGRKIQSPGMAPLQPSQEQAPTADLAEKPESWLPQESARGREQEEASAPKQLLKSFNPSNSRLDLLVKGIQQRFNGNQSCILLFAGSEDNPNCDFAAAQVAWCLSNKGDGRVLLIDTNLPEPMLTKSEDLRNRSGLCDHLLRGARLDKTIRSTCHAALDFLPLGQAKNFDPAKAGLAMPVMVDVLRSQYKYVCVSLGDAHQHFTPLWSSFADGVYLVVSMLHSSQIVAKSAVVRLRSCGARLSGCVLSDDFENAFGNLNRAE
jgi:Mrp family chromosome partitioning ATPase